ncbi:unnamed protein product, partial [Phaeothamnion confervicola]
RKDTFPSRVLCPTHLPFPPLEDHGDAPRLIIPVHSTKKRMPTSMGNREAIRLYRDILRGCRRFHWCNEHGVPWNKLLRDSARKEFEQAREEKDPLIVARLLVMGRQCLNDTLYKVSEKRYSCL